MSKFDELKGSLQAMYDEAIKEREALKKRQEEIEETIKMLGPVYGTSTKKKFSLETLSPTYRLAMGVPGRSNAFEISKKLGLPGSITDRARMLLDGGDIQFEEVISALEEDKRKAEEERDEAIMLNVAVKKEKAELDKKMRRFEEQRENMLNDAKAQARDIIKDAQSTAKEVQAELRELSRIESMGERNKRFDESRKRLRDKAGRYREKIIKEVNDNPVAPEDLKLGDIVKVLPLKKGLFPDDHRHRKHIYTESFSLIYRNRTVCIRYDRSFHKTPQLLTIMLLQSYVLKMKSSLNQGFFDKDYPRWYNKSSYLIKLPRTTGILYTVIRFIQFCALHSRRYL